MSEKNGGVNNTSFVLYDLLGLHILLMIEKMVMKVDFEERRAAAPKNLTYLVEECISKGTFRCF